MADKNTRPIDQQDDELFENLYPVVSSMECTGMIPAAPVNSAEADSYSDIYDIPLAKSKKDANNRIQDDDVSNTPTPHQD